MKMQKFTDPQKNLTPGAENTRKGLYSMSSHAESEVCGTHDAACQLPLLHPNPIFVSAQIVYFPPQPRCPYPSLQYHLQPSDIGMAHRQMLLSVTHMKT